MKSMVKKAARVFLDSNVILSGLISDKGAPRIILDLLCLNLPVLIGLTGRYDIIEIERNLKKKRPDIFPIYEEYFPKLRFEIVPLPSPEEVRRFSGSISNKDVPVLVSAIRGRADFLVTGDKKDFDKLKVRGNYNSFYSDERARCIMLRLLISGGTIQACPVAKCDWGPLTKFCKSA